MKKAKRLVALLLAMALVLSLTACGSKNEAQNNTASSAPSAGTSTVDKNFKVGVIHIGDPASGSGYSYTHDQGIVAMQKALGLDDSQIIRKNNVSDSDANATKTAIEECIEAGCKLIFGTSWGYMDTMEAMAKEYPDVKFSHATGYKSNGTNFNNYFGRIYQARYLTGIAAGMKSKSNKIGYVGAMDSTNSEVTGGIDAFAMGVKSVNPTAKVYVKITNTWYDPTKEQQAAEALLDAGCDVIAQHQDTTAPQLAAEKRGVWSIGYNSDMSKDAPNAEITSAVWNWGVYYTETTKAVMNGTWDAKNYYGGMKEGLVDIAPLTKNAAEGTQAKIDEAKAKILDGSLKIFDGELKDNKGNIVCKQGQTLTDAEITGKINWYYENVVVQ